MPSLKIRLLISNVDGTLLTPGGVLTKRTRGAIRALQAAGIHFAMVSQGLAAGLQPLIRELSITAPCASLRGGVLFSPDGNEIFERHIREATAQETVGILERFSLDPWVYTSTRWYVVRPETLHVQIESHTSVVSPEAFKSMNEIRGAVIKVTGVADDHHGLAECKEVLKNYFCERLSISSRTNFIDVTHRDANKGMAVVRLSGLLAVPLEEVAVVGTCEDDIEMFRVSGMSIAIGQAPPELRGAATYSAPSNDDDGLAWAIENLILENLLSSRSCEAGGHSYRTSAGENDE